MEDKNRESSLEDKLNLFKFTTAQLKKEMMVVSDHSSDKWGGTADNRSMELELVTKEGIETLARMHKLNNDLENTINSLCIYNLENERNLVVDYKNRVSSLENKLNLFKFTTAQLKEEIMVVSDDSRGKCGVPEQMSMKLKPAEESTAALGRMHTLNHKIEDTISMKEDIENELQQVKEAMESITSELVRMVKMIERNRTHSDTDN